MDSRRHFFEFNAYPHQAFAAPGPASPVNTTHKSSRSKMELKQWEENGGQLVTMTENQMELTSDDHGSPQLMNSFKLVEKRCDKDGELRSSSLSWSSERRCQVEGCNSALVGAKEYHKKHKVCESHSKAPKVAVKGIEQRFCQQCSRFHVVSEFDGAKRSCRRKLAWHNRRRRKSFFGTIRAIPSSSQSGRALSLLSPASDSNISLSSSRRVDMFPIPNTDIREQTSEKQAPLYSTEPYLLSPKIRSWPHANAIGNYNVGNQLINQTFIEGAQYLPCANIGSWDLMQVPDTFDLFCDSKLK